MTLNTFFIIYLLVGAIVSIPLARSYWRNFRSSNHKSNIIHPLKIVNRMIDSYVFIMAWVIITVLYPIALIELLVKKYKEARS